LAHLDSDDVGQGFMLIVIDDGGFCAGGKTKG